MYIIVDIQQTYTNNNKYTLILTSSTIHYHVYAQALDISTFITLTLHTIYILTAYICTYKIPIIITICNTMKSLIYQRF